MDNGKKLENQLPLNTEQGNFSVSYLKHLVFKCTLKDMQMLLKMPKWKYISYSHFCRVTFSCLPCWGWCPSPANFVSFLLGLALGLCASWINQVVWFMNCAYTHGATVRCKNVRKSLLNTCLDCTSRSPEETRGNQKPAALWIQQHLHPPLPSREGCIYSTESMTLSLRLYPFVSLFWGILLRRWGTAYNESQFVLALGSGRNAFYSTERNTVSSESKICADWSWPVRREFFLLSLRRNPHQSPILSQGLLRQG